MVWLPWVRHRVLIEVHKELFQTAGERSFVLTVYGSYKMICEDPTFCSNVQKSLQTTKLLRCCSETVG